MSRIGTIFFQLACTRETCSGVMVRYLFVGKGSTNGCARWFAEYSASRTRNSGGISSIHVALVAARLRHVLEIPRTGFLRHAAMRGDDFGQRVLDVGRHPLGVAAHVY